MEQETRTLFARRHDLKRKKRTYQKVAETATQEDSSSEDKAQQCHSEGAIAIYHHEEVEEG